MAIKSEQQIERDFYLYLSTTALGKELRGSIYRDEMRPANAKTEDLVLKLIAGTDEQIQEGVIVCNIYVPDLQRKGGKSVKDFDRIAVLESLAIAIPSDATREYKMRTDGTPTTIAVEGTGQHMIVLRIRYRRISD